MSTKFLFFLERDFHVSMLKPLIEYIYAHGLGEIKAYSYRSKDLRGLLDMHLSFAVEIVDNPDRWHPDITFVADFCYHAVEGLGKIVNIGHGTISKGWFYSTGNITLRDNCADLLCVPGTIHQERLAQKVFRPIVVTGMPKLDVCFNGTLTKDSLYRKYGFDPNQKTVLLAPTFNEEFSILPYLVEKDMNLIFPDSINLIVKLHGETDPKILDTFKSLKTTERNVYLAGTYDTSELFYISDVLISDVSSVIYEFVSLGKPALIFDSPRQKEYINYDKSDLEWEFRDVGHRFTMVEELRGLIFNSLITSHNAKHTELADMFVSVKDGTSSERVVKAAINLLGKDRAP